MPTLSKPTSPAGVKRFEWLKTARYNQLPPEGDWNVWMLLAGRGFGKTRCAAEDMAWYGLMHPSSRLAIMAETFGDGRDDCIEGVSGLLAALPEQCVLNWNRSLGELILTNQTRYKVFSGDKPDQARGKNHHRVWMDELAKYRYAQDAWDQMMLTLRLGEHPQAVVTTTPRPIEIIRQLVKRADEDVAIVTGSTSENADHLSPSFLASVRDRYAGTRLGRQELEGEILDDIPGALWTRAMVDEPRVRAEDVPDMVRVVVAIDPAGTSGEDSDETGIVVAGKGADSRGYVLADLSGRYTPDEWARIAVTAYHTWEADRLVAEQNYGGDMVERVIRTVDPRISYKKVTATRGKRLRAEPISALYEQRRVSHVGAHPQLEDQMVAFVPDMMSGSPDRVDALVWALTELMLERKGTRKMRVIR